jgi:hypothetical protein
VSTEENISRTNVEWDHMSGFWTNPVTSFLEECESTPREVAKLSSEYAVVLKGGARGSKGEEEEMVHDDVFTEPVFGLPGEMAELCEEWNSDSGIEGKGSEWR